ncbi:hypothetical protein KAR91_14095 [Candidatus Pacearchaeota archaeon]|nr:hypothetical protein [Candidatus Pacearchaeota archaeon]
MFFRIVITCLSVAVITSCATAKMAMIPGLEVNSEKYVITEQPKAFSGGNLVFGPYTATNISRSFVKSSGIGILGIGKKKKGQDYTFQFKGNSSWNGDCKVESSNMKFGNVSGAFRADLDCTFLPVDSESAQASGWSFNMSGGMSGPTQGSIEIASKTIKVTSTNKIEGSPISLEQHTGYYFHSGSTIIAGVDAINKQGPVWMNKGLTQKEKDIISMTIVALLMNQVN